jgi:hypothetical protein
VAEDDDRAFWLREAVEGAFEGHRGARGFDGLHDALLEGGLRGPVRDHMVPGLAESSPVGPTSLERPVGPTGTRGRLRLPPLAEAYCKLLGAHEAGVAFLAEIIEG